MYVLAYLTNSIKVKMNNGVKWYEDNSFTSRFHTW